MSLHIFGPQDRSDRFAATSCGIRNFFIRYLHVIHSGPELGRRNIDSDGTNLGLHVVDNLKP